MYCRGIDSRTTETRKPAASSCLVTCPGSSRFSGPISESTSYSTTTNLPPRFSPSYTFLGSQFCCPIMFAYQPRAYALNLIRIPVGKQHFFEKLRIQGGIPLFAREALLGRMPFQHHQGELSQ